MPVASIIAGVVGVASTVVSAVGASSSAEAAEEEAQRQREEEEREAEKNRKLKRRDQNLEGLNYLASQRQQAQANATTMQFNRDAKTALKSVSNSRQAPQPAPVAPPMTAQAPAPMPQRRQAPPIAPQMPNVGMRNTTLGGM